MPLITIDPLAKLITVSQAPVAGKLSIDVRDELYGAAKQYWLTDDLANKFTFPFEPSGGRAISATTAQGSYYFLRTDLGWRIRPYEDDYEQTFVGNLYPINPLDPMIVPTLGAFTVAIFFERSVLTQSLVTGGSGGLSTEQDLRLTRIDVTTQSTNANNPGA